MALFPALATIDLLPQAESSPLMLPRLLCAHTTGGPGTPANIRRYFARPGNGVFSHFVIGWDGSAVQMCDTARQAPAQWDANPFAVSFETQDDGDPSQPWTQLQMAKLTALMKAVAAAHRIPTTLASRWDGSGVTFHEAFPELNHSSHRCPGPVREAQLRLHVIPALTAPAPAPTPEVDVPLTDAEIEKIAQAVTAKLGADVTHPYTVGYVSKQNAEIKATLDRLAAKAGA